MCTHTHTHTHTHTKVGVVHVGDVVTFFPDRGGWAAEVGADEDQEEAAHTHVGQVECIYSLNPKP
jgi:hypothetical protein